MEEIERRFFKTTVEIRATPDGKKMIIGYGAIFNQLSENLGGFREMIMPGAFADVLKDDTRSLFNHDPNLILGRTLANTLALSEDDLGLRYEVTPPDVQYARDLLISIGRGDVDGSSFGFRIKEDSWQRPDENNPIPIRKIHKFARLYDVGPVTFPAYPTTTAQVRAMLTNLSGATELQASQDVARRLQIRKRYLELLERF